MGLTGHIQQAAARGRHKGAFETRREVVALLVGAAAARILIGVLLLYVVLPYYEARQMPDLWSYERRGERVGDAIRTGAWDRIAFGIGVDSVSLVFGGIKYFFGSSREVLIAFGVIASWCAAVLIVKAWARLASYQPNRWVVVYLLLSPSVITWSVLPGKDCLVFPCLASAIDATSAMRFRLSSARTLQLACSLGFMFLIRPHVASCALAALAVAFVVGMKSDAKKVLVAVALLAGFLSVVPTLARYATLQELSVGGVAERLGRSGAENALGGSAVPIQSVRGFRDWLQYLPFGVLRLVLRPLPWETTSPFTFFAGVDQWILVVLLLSRVKQIRTNAWNAVSGFHSALNVTMVILLACLYSTISNLGIIPRARLQLVPFVLGLALSLKDERTLALEETTNATRRTWRRRFVLVPLSRRPGTCSVP